MLKFLGTIVFKQMLNQLRLAEKIIIIYSPKLVIRNSNAYCVYNLLAKPRRWICPITVPERKEILLRS
jgi:hypothetical protein